MSPKYSINIQSKKFEGGFFVLTHESNLLPPITSKEVNCQIQLDDGSNTYTKLITSSYSSVCVVCDCYSPKSEILIVTRMTMAQCHPFYVVKASHENSPFGLWHDLRISILYNYQFLHFIDTTFNPLDESLNK